MNCLDSVNLGTLGKKTFQKLQCKHLLKDMISVLGWRNQYQF